MTAGERRHGEGRHPGGVDGAGGAARATRADRQARAMELALAGVLRAGVVASLVAIVVGAVEGFVDRPAARTSVLLEHHLLSAGAAYPHDFGAVATGLVHGDPVAIMVLGLVLLVLTPVLRVAVSILTFLHQRDRVFVAVTSAVLLVLIGSFLVGGAGG